MAPARLGTPVAYSRMPDVYAARARVPSEWAFALSPGIFTRVAAASLMQGTTAHYLACDAIACGPGTTAAVLAGAGGVGRLLVQLCRRQGAQVVYDSPGRLTFRESLAALARRGGWCTTARPTGEIEPFRPAELAGFNRRDANGSLYVTWTSNRDSSATPEEFERRMAAFFAAISEG